MGKTRRADNVLRPETCCSIVAGLLQPPLQLPALRGGQASKQTIHAYPPNQFLVADFLDKAIDTHLFDHPVDTHLFRHAVDTHFFDDSVNSYLFENAIQSQHVDGGADIKGQFLSSGTGHGFNLSLQAAGCNVAS